MQNVGHHYVTESYQLLFADSNDRVTVLTPEGKIITANPKNFFKTDHFYTVKMANGGGTLAVENILSQIEGAFIAVMKDKVHKRLPLNGEDKQYIAMFVAAMFNRTKPQREHEQQMFQDLKRSMTEWQKQFETLSPEHRRSVNAVSSGGGPTLTLKELEEGLKDFDSHQSVSTLSSTSYITPILLDMEWMLIEAPEGKEFLSSDNPLCMCSPAREKEYGAHAIGALAGLRHTDVEVTFPLSKRFALVTLWKKHGEEYETALPGMVDQINYRSIRSSDNIFSGDRNLLEEILSKFLKQ